MNKKKFVDTLQEKTKLSNEECVIVTDILEDNFIFSKKNKEKIVSCITKKLEVDRVRAESIYNISMGIILYTAKDKIKHPFKSQD